MDLRKGYEIFCAVTDCEVGCEGRQYYYCSAPTLSAAKMIFEDWSRSFKARRGLGNFKILKVFTVSEKKMSKHNREFIWKHALVEEKKRNEALLAEEKLLTSSLSMAFNG